MKNSGTNRSRTFTDYYVHGDNKVLLSSVVVAIIISSWNSSQLFAHSGIQTRNVQLVKVTNVRLYDQNYSTKTSYCTYNFVTLSYNLEFETVERNKGKPVIKKIFLILIVFLYRN